MRKFCTHSVPRLLAPVILLAHISASAAVPESGSVNQILRSPGFADGSTELLRFAGSKASNPNLAPIQLSNGISLKSSVSVDEPNAQLRAYLDYSLPTPIPSAPYLQAFGSLGAYSVFHGPSASSTEAVPITFELSFHGKISSILPGNASLNLAGGVSLDIRNSLDGDTLERDTVVLSFLQTSGQVQVLQTTDQELNNGPVNHSFAGAHVNPLSTSPGNILGIVSLTTLVKPGQWIILQNGLLSAASVSSQSGGTIDALNTASAKVYVPSGYSFDTTAESLFSHAVVAVPEPQSYLLFGIGFGLLAFYRRRIAASH